MTTKSSSKSEHKRTRLAIAGLAFGIAAATAYMVQRVFELHTSEPVDLMTMLSETRVGFTWRSITAGWLGLLAAAASYLLSSKIEQIFSDRPRLGPTLAIAWLVCLIASTYWWA